MTRRSLAGVPPGLLPVGTRVVFLLPREDQIVPLVNVPVGALGTVTESRGRFGGAYVLVDGNDHDHVGGTWWVGTGDVEALP